MTLSEHIKYLEGAELFYRRKASYEDDSRSKAYWLNKAIDKKEQINQLNEIA